MKDGLCDLHIMIWRYEDAYIVKKKLSVAYCVSWKEHCKKKFPLYLYMIVIILKEIMKMIIKNGI